jgi:hypothetical protein
LLPLSANSWSLECPSLLQHKGAALPDCAMFSRCSITALHLHWRCVGRLCQWLHCCYGAMSEGSWPFPAAA